MIGQELSPILIEIESAIIEFDYFTQSKPGYTDEAFRAACKIFMSALMDKMYNLQNYDKLSLEDRCNMSKKAGAEFRKLVKTYTDFDTTKFYK